MIVQDAIKAHRNVIVVATIYTIVILALWASYNIGSGLPYETTFPYYSENTSWWKGFIFPSDPLRPNTSTFYHLSFLLGELTGVPGSFVTYQIVYACLWFFRGFLFFLILRRFFGPDSLIPFVSGAFVLVHSADGSINWVGQMNQYGYIFWMLLATYYLIDGYEETDHKWMYIKLSIVAFSLFMSQWSYESHLIILLTIPIFLLFLHTKDKKKFRIFVGTWWIIEGLYLYQTFGKYSSPAYRAYQKTVVQESISVAKMMSDWIFNISASVCFWRWSEAPQAEYAIPMGIISGVVLLLGILIVCRHTSDVGSLLELMKSKPIWIGWGIGLYLLVFSFPVYLLLDSSRSLWRTQILSGLGFGLLFATSSELIAKLFRSNWQQKIVFCVIVSVVGFFGTEAAVRSGAYHRSIWEKHRSAIAHILEAVPKTKPGTILVLLNVPKDSDPFGHNMWFDVAIRLAYPRQKIVGIYFLDDGSPSDGCNMNYSSALWTWNKAGFPKLLDKISIRETIFLNFKTDGPAEVYERVPAKFFTSDALSEFYKPRERILDGPADERAQRRYLR